MQKGEMRKRNLWDWEGVRREQWKDCQKRDTGSKYFFPTWVLLDPLRRKQEKKQGERTDGDRERYKRKGLGDGRWIAGCKVVKQRKRSTVYLIESTATINEER